MTFRGLSKAGARGCLSNGTWLRVCGVMKGVAGEAVERCSCCCSGSVNWARTSAPRGVSGACGCVDVGVVVVRLARKKMEVDGLCPKGVKALRKAVRANMTEDGSIASSLLFFFFFSNMDRGVSMSPGHNLDCNGRGRKVEAVESFWRNSAEVLHVTFPAKAAAATTFSSSTTRQQHHIQSAWYVSISILFVVYKSGS